MKKTFHAKSNPNSRSEVLCCCCASVCMREVSFLRLCCTRIAVGGDGTRELFPENDSGHCQRTRGEVYGQKRLAPPGAFIRNITGNLASPWSCMDMLM